MSWHFTVLGSYPRKGPALTWSLKVWARLASNEGSLRVMVRSGLESSRFSGGSKGSLTVFVIGLPSASLMQNRSNLLEPQWTLGGTAKGSKRPSLAASVVAPPWEVQSKGPYWSVTFHCLPSSASSLQSID